jgi:G:T-mismatch repair DNA endonuclease (very short patch repair protein)
MADVFTKEKRSDVMSRIRSSGTGIEERLYHAVHATLRHRWRIDRNDRTLAGNRRRDRRTSRTLRKAGCSVWRLWEHELRGRSLEITSRRLGRRLERRVITR